MSGRVTISPEVPPSIFAKLHLDAGYEMWKDQTVLDWRAFYTCNVSVKRNFLVTYGLFEENIRYHEDLELSERLSRHGLTVIYNPKALGYHYHHLLEQEYLSVAQREGKALAVWYRKSPQLRDKLASIGFYLALPFSKRLRYYVGDLLFNDLSIPGFLLLARFLSKHSEKTALIIYRKVFQALKRKAIRHELLH